MQIPTLTRGRRALLWALGGLAVLLLLAWLVLPHWLRRVAQEQATATLGREVRIDALRFNPLTLTLRIDGLQIAGPTREAAPLLRLAHMAIDADVRSIFRLAPVVEAVDVQGPDLRVARLADGRYDVDDLIERLRPRQAPPAGESPARFALYNLSLSGGTVRFDDRPKGRVHELRALTLGVPFVSNLDDAVDVHVEPRLAFDLDGTHVDTGAQAKPFTPDRAGLLTLRTGEINLADWQAYLPAALPLRPLAGRLLLDLSLQFKAPATGLAELVIKGGLQAKAVRLVDAADAPLAELDSLGIQLDELQPLRRRAAVRSIVLDGFTLTAARDAQARVNWLRALGVGQAVSAAEAASAPAQATPAAQAGWQFSLGRLAVQAGRVQWSDRSVQPAAQMGLEALSIQLDGSRWPVAADAPAARLNAQAQLASVAPAASAAVPTAAPAAVPGLQLRGEWSATGGELQLLAQSLPVVAAAPYLAAVLKPRLDGQLALDATARWQGVPGDQLPSVQIAMLQFDGLSARLPGERQPAAAWKQLRVAELAIDPAARQLDIGRLDLIQPQLRARRDSSGQVDLAQWVVDRPDQSVAAQAPGVPPWSLRLHGASIEDGRVAWQDRLQGAEPVVLELQRLALKLRGLQWPAQAKARASLQGSVQVRHPGAGGAPGRLAWQGDLGLAPVSWRGRLKAEHLPVHAVSAYAGTALPVAVGRAELGWAGQTSVSWAGQGLELDAKGDARVDDLRLFARRAAGVRDGDELLSWQSLELPGVQLAMAPGRRPRVELGEARLSDFYARLSIDEAGQFNLSGLNAPAASASAPLSAVPASTPASAPSAGPALDLAVAGLQLKNGRVDFSDRFIRPNYSAALSELSGRLGAFRTGTRDMATLDLQGRVAGTGLLEVRGSLNPTAQPLALDVQARASDLELAPLSPYAGKYAGYAIERGKLTMDVAYRIEADGRLDARNKIVLNQLTFGERIESADATKLPVLLAVALLKDSRGVIDLDLPIGGSINDPEFSIGGVVIKIIVNLLTKALTAPFSLLAGGGGEDLSQVEFQPGTARLADGADVVIDKVARALAERSALQMTVTGAADPQSEREAIQAAWLDGRLTAEWRKERLRAGHAADAVAPTSWAPDERARLVRRLYADTPLPNKPRNVLGLAKDIPPVEMEALLRSSHVVSTDNARELALQRGLAVRDALLAKGLPSERLFLAAPKLRASGEDDAGWTPRVQLGLGTP
ncbi:MAG: DUF748 domain-containing protein [Pseudomonadota bacterium]